ncbi:COX aromatic rich motif-containing protein [Acidihalobacter ferrooxydans]|uniref:Ubiquinol oxidase subunit 2 n=1 Tax=Acidihalobacter ferrooxydans TaxID=1765967 RepID=A0A1P8UEV8_9GAMM|nr:COX aromatic rich motif-containing protein [Acidihalobacter ferrooxydans]APZ42346.1 hypothetical protein BW247_03950 [Acidihalobacter ferrooxydans]
MERKSFPSYLRYLAFLPLLLLGGCSGHNFWLLDPKGAVAKAELHYMILDVSFMAIVIVPTTFLLIWVVWRYRASRNATYKPKWSHSNTLELVVWGIPLVIVGALSYFSWEGIHQVNPYNPGAVNGASDLAAAHDAPLEVDVITTDWQWMFIYPKQHIAVANELVVPTGTKVHFRLTSTSVVNSFFIPQIVGQIYAMPGMRTKQALEVSYPGSYHGFSAAFSGPGFSWMDFKLKAVPPQQFAQWVKKIGQKNGGRLDYATFKQFAKPTVNVADKIDYYANVQPGLFAKVVNAVRAQKLHYVTPMSMTENMHSDIFRQHSN